MPAEWLDATSELTPGNKDFVMVVQEGSEEMTDGEGRVNGGAERGQEEQEEETSDAPEEAELELGR